MNADLIARSRCVNSERLWAHDREEIVSEQTVAFEYAETGSGPALLFLPGSFGTGAGWKAVLGDLGDGYRTVTTSLLGYGATPDIGRMAMPP